MDDLGGVAGKELKQRAKASYERGRLVDALPWAVPVLGWTAVCAYGQAAIWPAPFLIALVVLMRFIGQDWGKGVPLGLGAGMVTGLYPLLAACSTSCGPSCAAQCAMWTVGFGVAAALLFYRQLPFATGVAALVVCACTALMACTVMGGVGLYGAAAVVVVGSGFQLASRPWAAA